MKAKSSAKKTTEQSTTCGCNTNNMCNTNSNGCGIGLYGLGVIGAAVYFISLSTSFWTGVLGVLKALVWPAFLVFELFRFLGVN